MSDTERIDKMERLIRSGRAEVVMKHELLGARLILDGDMPTNLRAAIDSIPESDQGPHEFNIARRLDELSFAR